MDIGGQAVEARHLEERRQQLKMDTEEAARQAVEATALLEERERQQHAKETAELRLAR